MDGCSPPPGLRRRKTAAERRQQRMRSEARVIQRMLKSFYLLGHHRGSQLSMLGRAMERALLEAAADPAVGQPVQTGVDRSRPPGVWICNGMLWANPVVQSQATMESRPTTEKATGGKDVVEIGPTDNQGHAEDEESIDSAVGPVDWSGGTDPDEVDPGAAHGGSTTEAPAVVDEAMDDDDSISSVGSDTWLESIQDPEERRRLTRVRRLIESRRLGTISRGEG